MKQFEQMRKMMKQMNKLQGMGLGNILPPGMKMPNVKGGLPG